MGWGLGREVAAPGESGAHPGRQRKYYSLTRKGHQRLAAETRQWQALLKVFSSLGVVAETSQGTVQGAS